MNKISFNRLFKEYPYESGILSVAVTIAVASLLAVFLTNKPVQGQKMTDIPSIVHTPIEPHKTGSITIDISGAVGKPDVYTFSYSPRIKDVIQMAGGLLETADSEFIGRNFNMARYVSDQEKIYLPYRNEIQSGIFVEDPRKLEYLTIVNPNENQVHSASGSTSGKININNATADELDSLEGIGTTLSKSIIDHRPYKNINELISKKVLKQATYTKIKDSLSI